MGRLERAHVPEGLEILRVRVRVSEGARRKTEGTTRQDEEQQQQEEEESGNRGGRSSRGRFGGC